MFQNEYNQIIREHFDISDTTTRKTIIALEDAEQSQLLSALTNALYDKIIAKVDNIDFGTIPNSRGDITKVEGFENTVECLNIMRKIVLEYHENPEVVDTVITAIENIKSRKGTFVKAYALNVEFPMVLYNLITFAIEQSVSFLVSVCIQYIKDPSSQNMNAALDKVAYNNTKENLVYEQLYAFNKSCLSGETDKVLINIMKNGGRIQEGFESSENYQYSESPFNDDNNCKEVPCAGNADCKCPKCVPVNGSTDAITPNDVPVEEFAINPFTAAAIAKIGTGVVIGAKTLAISGAVVYFILKVLIPLLRAITYFCINSRVKFSELLSTQAQFIEANAIKLQYSTVEDDEKKEKTVGKQMRLAEKLRNFANKVSIDNKKAENEAKKLADSENKKFKIDDLKNDLGPDITTKSLLF